MSWYTVNNRASSLVALGVFVVVLLFILSWGFRSGNVIAGSFQVDDIQICEDLDDNMKPVRSGVALPGGTSKVCIWFRYSKAREGDSLEILWNHEGRSIQKDVFRISKPNGVRAFYLMREDRSSLPHGEYEVVLMCNGRKKVTKEFTVINIKKDVLKEKK